MKAAIVGYAVEGQVSANYWHELGYEVTICDQNTSLQVPPIFKTALGDDYLDGLDSYDIIVRSAGIHPQIILAKNPSVKSKITTSVQEFFRVCPSPNTIGITGTKGKGTTTTLITKMLIAAGKTVHFGGNIGIAPLELLPKINADDWVVLELSSFQLEDFNGPSPHIGVCLMVVPEHLNWHADMAEYISAKQRLFATQKPTDIAIYYSQNENSQAIAQKSAGVKIPYLASPGAIIDNNQVVINNQTICSVEEIKLPGKHNWQNICAAVTAAWQITQDLAAIKSVILSFSGLDHRIELVREINEIKYYDDSFATTPETAIAAIQAFNQPKILILGGSDKGTPLDPIANEVINNNIRHIITIGDTGPTIAKQLHERGYNDITEGLKTMTEIVATAQSHAEPGDVVLLSTGCASFGLFKDYKDRGNQFQDAVKSLN
ncbi:MAG: UDP-N-acetylmuramoyl-L-alanine--D-glutamate ligase [Candidatus Saccharibacteria bacterium]